MSVTKSKSVGVIGTVTTISSGAYQVEFNTKEADVDLHALACPGFVEFVERGDTSSDQVHVLAERLLAPFKDAKIDALLLGCTHYPFLARTISDVIGREVVLVSSADETAFEVNRLLKTNDLVADTNEVGQRVFLSSGDPDEFAKIGRSLLGEPLYDVMLWEP
jgi:glutamate racemase